MKTLISLVIAIIIVATLSCQKEQATKYTQNIDMNTILNDSNWVEVTDTIDVTHEIICLAEDILRWGIVLQSESEYKEMWEKSVRDYPNDIINCNKVYVYDSTIVKYKTPNVDFNNRSVLGFFVRTTLANKFRYIYKNEKTKEYLYLLNLELTSFNKIGDGYFAWTSVPKIPIDYKVSFDTTITDNR